MWDQKWLISNHQLKNVKKIMKDNKLPHKIEIDILKEQLIFRLCQDIFQF